MVYAPSDWYRSSTNGRLKLATSRPYDAFYRRAGQAMNLVSHDHLLSDSYGNSPYSTKKDTPELETKPSGPPRKRVPVACDRCRKRKIKCSGDQGDGSGCDNCKSAGWEGCQFLRVKSEFLDVHPTISASRSWNHHQYRYEPYSTRSRHVPYLTQHHPYSQPQSTSTYSMWPTSVDYSSIGSSHTPPLPWSQHNFSTPYTMYENENTSPYSTQPPSYMLPDIDHGIGARASMTYMNSMSRPQQSSLWLDQMNSASVPQQISSIYPLTPIESTKTYPMLSSQPGQHALSHERTLPQPSLSNNPASVSSNGRDTPPLSAISHRSSHTWNTDTASHVSSTSSRTSCGDSQDLSTAAQSLTTCEDQAVVYPYPAESASPQINMPATSLPNGTEAHEQQHAYRTASHVSEANALMLQGRSLRDSLRASSPASALYGYANHRSSSRRGHSMLPTRLMTSGFPTNWNPSPTSTRNSSLSSQQPLQVQEDVYPEHRSSTSSSLNASASY